MCLLLDYFSPNNKNPSKSSTMNIIIPYSSGQPISLYSNNGCLYYYIIGFGSNILLTSYPPLDLSLGNISFSPITTFTITSFYVVFTTVLSSSIYFSSPNGLQATIYIIPPNSSIFSQGIAAITPISVGTITSGTIINMSLNNLNIQVSPGSQILICISLLLSPAYVSTLFSGTVSGSIQGLSS